MSWTQCTKLFSLGVGQCVKVLRLYTYLESFSAFSASNTDSSVSLSSGTTEGFLSPGKTQHKGRCDKGLRTRDRHAGRQRQTEREKKRNSVSPWFPYVILASLYSIRWSCSNGCISEINKPVTCYNICLYWFLKGFNTLKVPNRGSLWTYLSVNRIL